MVIQCPQCKTKFSVNAGQLADVEEPRFHCSRCDHYFEMAIPKNEISPRVDIPTAAPLEKPEKLLAESKVEVAASPTIPEATASPLIQPEAELSLNKSDSVITAAATPDKVAGEAPVVSEVPKAQEPSVVEEITIDFSMAKPIIPEAEQLDLLPGEDIARETALADSFTGTSEERKSLLDDDDLPQIRAEWPKGPPDHLIEADMSSARELLGKSVSKPLSASIQSESIGSSPSTATLTGLSFREGVLNDEVLLGESTSSGKAEPIMFSASAGSVVTPASINTQPIPTAPSFSAKGLKGFGATSKKEEQEDLDIDQLISEQIDISIPSLPSSASALSATSKIAPSESDTPFTLGEAEKAKPKTTVVDFERVKEAAREVTGSKAKGVVIDSIDDLGDDSPVFPIAGAGLGREERSGFSALSLVIPVLIFCSGPILFAAGCFIWGRNLEGTPAALASVLHLGNETLPKLPPPGIEVVDLHSEVINLDDGTQVLRVMGDLINSTTRTYKDVQLESSVFDGENRELEKIVVSAHNGLSTTSKINSLRKEALERLQEERATGSFTLKPNDRLPFSLIFTDEVAGAAFFSARIYSVRTSL